MIFDQFKKAWNAFFNKDPTITYNNVGVGSYYNPDRKVVSHGKERTIIPSVMTRIAMDVSQIKFSHVRLDENDRYAETIKDSLNSCLSLSANIDQTGRAFMQDVVISMLDEGMVAIVPTYTEGNPFYGDSYKILEMRVGKIMEFFPKYVRVQVYNDKTGLKEELTLPKHMVAIIENPLFSVMNEPNSTMQRLIRSLSLLDQSDAKSSSSKLDLIIQLPFAIKGDLRVKQAEERKTAIEDQLRNSPLGIAYLDSTEHVTQLNRPVDNQMFSRIESLTKQLYTQLGITEEILNGTASPDVLNNYYTRTIEPICSAIADEMKRKFLTKTALTQGQSIAFFRDLFKLVPIASLADLGDKMITNEIMTSNEFRQVIGLKPSDSPGADDLRNKHLNAPEGEGTTPEQLEGQNSEEEIQNG